MTNEQELILWILTVTVAAFGAGCSLGSTFRTKHPRKAANGSRRK
jgi:hypothetical protein